MTTFAPRAALAPTGEMQRQFVRFIVIGVANTGLSLAFYLLFRVVTTATVANLAATVLTTVIGTILNGRLTFGVRGLISVSQHAKSMAVTVLGFVITTVAVNMADGSAMGEMAALIVSSGVAGAVRFILMRYWVFTAPAR
ncbi:GtrA family protein [Kibdelosporangium philippinense]|uniref:GtrA family protein n=1 Tax=Kibdelosporangium philippinense TaxID=211113 RepID=A0ABS8ZT48_9PSEU|nr:GtrA family protein [Kibdelosporangium philippinense]MCE7010905.1 GtrA family protein [Kibdelosporangium philippinense]